MTQRWKLTLEYEGTHFLGWQRQKEGLTVQSCLEDAIHGFCGEHVTAHVAGRTDAGVHALGQVVHVDLFRDADEKTICEGINYHMRPHAVSVIQAEPVDQEFHARFSAKSRVYCYRILMGRRPLPVIATNQYWFVRKELDVDAMQRGANYLLGQHDFSSFRDAECQAKTPIRSMDRLEFVEKTEFFGKGRYLELWAEAPSFLHHQIRNIVGSLKLVGEGKWKPEDIKRVLEARNRDVAGPTASPDGLFFIRVNY